MNTETNLEVFASVWEIKCTQIEIYTMNLTFMYSYKYSQVGMDGHPSAQARALVTLGNPGRFWGVRFPKMYFPRRAFKITPQNGVYGGFKGLRFIYIYIYIFPISQLANSKLADLRT